jgi:hypothetical protein
MNKVDEIKTKYKLTLSMEYDDDIMSNNIDKDYLERMFEAEYKRIT